jgi:hypothetical protein
VFPLLEACLGLSVFKARFARLPSPDDDPGYKSRTSLHRSLLTRHDEGDVGVNVLRRDGVLDVLVLNNCAGI